MGRTVYMRISSDKYELPMAVTDTVTELSQLTGQSQHCINSIVSRTRQGKKGSVIQVEIDDEGEDENE